VRDAVVLKTVGATRGQIRAAWLVEFGLLGLVAGLLAAAAGSAASWAVVRFVMRGEWVFLPGTLALVVIGCVGADARARLCRHGAGAQGAARAAVAQRVAARLDRAMDESLSDSDATFLRHAFALAGRARARGRPPLRGGDRGRGRHHPGGGPLHPGGGRRRGRSRIRR
jgi:hypothetical protein